jgi:hypothetical protein
MTDMMPSSLAFTPNDWFWSASDGRIYSSASNSLVYAYDSRYLAFVAQWGGCTPWPTDDAGQQTAAALAAVVSQYGITIAI